MNKYDCTDLTFLGLNRQNVSLWNKVGNSFTELEMKMVKTVKLRLKDMRNFAAFCCFVCIYLFTKEVSSFAETVK